MGDLERRGGSEQPDQPEREQLSPGEIDLTGVVKQNESLIDVIQDAITEAGDDKEVPEWGARVMARYAANHLPQQASALHHFAATGRIDKIRIYGELAALWSHPHCGANMREVINRLGTYVMAAHDDVRPNIDPELPQPILDAVAQYGLIFEAYLKLPDVDPREVDATLDGFHESAPVAFASLNDLIADVIETGGLEQRLVEAGVEDFASIDRDKVVRLARRIYDIVYLADHYVCFFK